MAFLGILTYLFFLFIRLQDWWEPVKGVPVDDIVIILIIVSLLPSLSKFIDILKLPQGKFLLLFLIVVFLSNLVNVNIDSSFEYGWKYLKFTIIFLAITLSVNSFPKLKWITPFIVLLVTFIAYQGIIQSKTGTNWAGQSLYWGNRIRWVGLFDGANTTALAFVFVTPFLLEYLFSGSWGMGYKVFSILSGYLILTGFYLANSRGGFLSLLSVILFFIITKLKNQKGLVFGVILVLTLFTFVAPSRMEEIDDSDKSTKGRINAWGEALQMVRYHNPLLGVGKGQFRNYTRHIAHNAFLQQLGETGLIGAFFWLGSIYATIKGILIVMGGKNMDPLRLSLYKGYFLGLIALLTGILFISADHELLYIWIAFLTSIMLVEKVELKFSFRDIKIIGLIEFAGIIGVYITVNLFKVIY